ncbi:MAG: hypothetical protein M1124_00810 [Candidatus Marsarchaeota archaeon]|nr:hypothetical protein [Candidatus Marsarchaeota archaeon]
MKMHWHKNIEFYIGLIVFSTMLGAAGQMLFKYSFASSYVAAFLLLGVLCYGLATIVYFFVLGRFHLSWIYSFNGLTYIFSMLLAHFVLLEQISLLRWAGIMIILAGVVLVGLSQDSHV